jgi:hypothetical protein
VPTASAPSATAASHRVLHDVADEHLGAFLAQLLDQVQADVADALHGEAVRAEFSSP